ncbi:MAG: DnaB-like helicase N-terminal domain-containing protein, partial [Intestinibacter sp.]
MFDEEIEKAMLFYIIFENEKFELTENDFVNPLNQKIIKAVNNLNYRKQEISMLTVKNEIADKDSNI